VEAANAANSIAWPDLELPPINLLSLGREDSPCQGRCVLRGGVCEGCLRTSDEITEWTLYEPHERLQVLNRINGASK
jgi:predicted Fe-S protein YdhL (DUF1289 family)